MKVTLAKHHDRSSVALKAHCCLFLVCFAAFGGDNGWRGGLRQYIA